MPAPDASPFLFGEDFRTPAAPAQAARSADAAADQAYGRGLAEGRRLADAQAAARLARAAEGIREGLGSLGTALDAALDATERDALLFFRSLAEAWMGRAVAADPLAPVAAAAAEAFRHLRGVPHLVVRVSPDLVEPAEALVKARGRESGFEGRVIVLGDDEAAPGDVRLEWADGGVVRDAAALRRAVDAVLATASGAAEGTSHPDRTSP